MYLFRGRINTEVMEVENVEDGTGVRFIYSKTHLALSSTMSGLCYHTVWSYNCSLVLQCLSLCKQISQCAVS